MSKKTKMFAVSDIHGHATLLKLALDKAGFEPDNPDHLFIGCGDYFDKGVENRQVLRYLEGLPRKVLVRGNHEDMLARILREGYIDYYDVYNGTDITATQFFGKRNTDEYGVIDIKNSVYRRINGFLEQTVDFFETQGYIFIHGWLPTTGTSEPRIYTPDWRKAPKKTWEYARFSEWQEMYARGLTVEGKQIVCGHRPTLYGRMFDKTRAKNDCGIFYGDGMIALDGCTVQSGVINVLVIEDFV